MFHPPTLINTSSKWPRRPGLNSEFSDSLECHTGIYGMGRPSPLFLLVLFQSHQEETYTCLWGHSTISSKVHQHAWTTWLLFGSGVQRNQPSGDKTREEVSAGPFHVEFQDSKYLENNLEGWHRFYVDTSSFLCGPVSSQARGKPEQGCCKTLGPKQPGLGGIPSICLVKGFNNMRNVFTMVLCERGLMVNIQTDFSYVEKMYTKRTTKLELERNMLKC